ncbi:MAG: hypothetical protein ACRC6I_04280 [Paracoccaceae bacterium]
MATTAAADPILSIDITLAEGEEYPDAVAVIRAAGAGATSLSLFWDELEPTPGVYAPKDNWPAIANIYFPFTGLDFTLTFSVIDTVADRRPPDLQGLPWDDPLVIARFTAHLTAVLERLPNVPIIAIAVGNEVDAHLADPDDIAAYARFLAAARTHLATLRPGLPVAAKLTFSGLTADPARLQPILDAGDAAFFTYYPRAPDFSLRPPTDAPADLDRMIDLAAGKPLWLLEAGYPSDGCGTAPDGQAEFVREIKAAAMARGDEIALLSFTFLTDLPEAAVDDLTQYYGVPGDCFRRYLGSLGLRTAVGAPKPAFAALSP